MVFYSILDSFWSFSWTWILVGVGCIFLVYAFQSKKQEELVDRLPGPLDLPFFRNELAFFCNQDEIHSKIMKYSEEFGPTFRLWLSSGPVIVFSTAEYAQDVLLNTKFVYKGDRFRSCFGFFLGDGLLTAPALLTKQSIYCAGYFSIRFGRFTIDKLPEQNVVEWMFGLPGTAK